MFEGGAKAPTPSRATFRRLNVPTSRNSDPRVQPKAAELKQMWPEFKVSAEAQDFREASDLSAKAPNHKAKGQDLGAKAQDPRTEGQEPEAKAQYF